MYLFHKMKSYIKIVKASKEDNKYNGDTKGTRLANAKFEVYDQDGKIVDKFRWNSGMGY